MNQTAEYIGGFSQTSPDTPLCSCFARYLISSKGKERQTFVFTNLNKVCDQLGKLNRIFKIVF